MKANKKAREKKLFLGLNIKLVSKNVLKRIHTEAKEQKRKNKKRQNKIKFKAPRGFKLAKSKRFDATKHDKQIEKGFETAKRWSKNV